MRYFIFGFMIGFCTIWWATTTVKNSIKNLNAYKLEMAYYD